MTAIAEAIAREAGFVEMKREYLPVEDRVVLRPVDAGGDLMKNGVIQPEMAREKPQEAEVVAVGPNVSVPYLKVGARVLYGKYSGTEVTIDDEDLLIMRATDLLLVFK